MTRRGRALEATTASLWKVTDEVSSRQMWKAEESMLFPEGT